MIEQKLASMSLSLPEPFAFPNPNRTGCVRVGDMLYLSGHPPAPGPGVKAVGKVPAEISEEEAYLSARAAALNMLASIKQELGSLEPVYRVVKLLGMVNSSPGFTRQFAVIDGASDLLLELWGPERGQHARSAVGMFELPRGIPVEVEGVFELER